MFYCEGVGDGGRGGAHIERLAVNDGARPYAAGDSGAAGPPALVTLWRRIIDRGGLSRDGGATALVVSRQGQVARAGHGYTRGPTVPDAGVFRTSAAKLLLT